MALSLALLFGIRSRGAALGLAAFIIVATTLFHLQPDSETEMHMFYKDIAIFGALLVIAVRQPAKIPSRVESATFAVLK